MPKCDLSPFKRVTTIRCSPKSKERLERARDETGLSFNVLGSIAALAGLLRKSLAEIRYNGKIAGRRSASFPVRSSDWDEVKKAMDRVQKFHNANTNKSLRNCII